MVNPLGLRCQPARVLLIGTLMSRTIAGLLLMALALALPATRASAAVDPMPFSLREPPFDAKISGLLSDAQKAIRDGKLNEALQILNLAHSLAPNNPYVLARLATVLNLSEMPPLSARLVPPSSMLVRLRPNTIPVLPSIATVPRLSA